MKRLLMACGVFVLAATGAAQTTKPAVLAGAWTLKFATVAEQPTCCDVVTLVLKTDGSKVTGTVMMGDWPGDAPITAGTIKDNQFTLTAIGELQSSSGYPRITVTGTVQGDAMKVTLSLGQVGSDNVTRKWEMTGQRAKEHD